MITYMPPRPGKNARKIIKRDTKSLWGATTRSEDLPLVVEKAKGVWIEDVDGRKFLDFGAGYAVVSTGHCNREVIESAKKQMDKLIHISGSDFYYDVQVKLAEKLIKITPGKFDKRVYFANSGAESLESSLKAARYFTRRPAIISFIGAFHGRTTVGMTISGSKSVQRAHFLPLLPEVYHTYYPYCYRCPLNLSYPDCKNRAKKKIDGIPLLPCVEHLTDVIFKRLVDPEDVAILFVEPIQGEGGYIVPPVEFLPLLRKITERYGIVMVADEIQTGMGRTGKMFAVEHWNVEPDIITVAKGIASGFPMAAVIGRAEIMDWRVDRRAWVVGSHGSTFGGNPVSCAAALKTIEIIENKLIDNVNRVSKYMFDRLEKMKDKYQIIGDVRGKGLMIGVEFVKNKETKEPLDMVITKNGRNIKQVMMGESFKRGLLLLPCGFNAVRFSPPLSINKEEAERGLDIFEEVVEEVEKKLKKARMI